ncbi:MAG TPA: ABC transporter ATP-binding protein [Stellaceae bacterium]|nr:ABC transporter ATP-binding protein [Stellaceae bacterium]
MSTAHLIIEGVVKRFPDAAAAAVDGVTLEIGAGEFFALLGPSGCGKTTLLRMLAGFERPDRGRILIDGQDMAAVPPYARPTNMMFQSYALFPHMTVAENVAFGLKQDKRPRAEIAERVKAMLDLVKLAPLAGRKPGQLSGGEKQRVALARALVKEPKLLLLDEPLTALDRKLREETRFEIVRIQQRVGITFMLVTHDQEEAMSMASRIAVMERGKIAQVGPPADVYERPANRFVAGFLGAINLFAARVARSESGVVHLQSDEAGASLSVMHAKALTPGTAVTVAVRPEKLLLGSTANPAWPNALSGAVRGLAYRGEASDVEIELASGKLMRATIANADPQARAALALGQRIFLGWRREAGVVLES